VAYSRAVLDTIAATALRSGPWVIINGVIRNRVVDTTRESIDMVRGAMSFPPFQAPVQSIVVGADDSIMLRREESGGSTQRWDIISAQGDPVGRISLPRSAQLAWLRGTVLWAVEPDENDVPWLVRYRLAR
jgi:hypothetical protein